MGALRSRDIEMDAQLALSMYRVFMFWLYPDLYPEDLDDTLSWYVQSGENVVARAPVKRV